MDNPTVMFPEPNRLWLFTVLMFVPLTNVSCLPDNEVYMAPPVTRPVLPDAILPIYLYAPSYNAVPAVGTPEEFIYTGVVVPPIC